MATQSSINPFLSAPYPHPSDDNGFLVDHVRLLCASYRMLTGRELVKPETTDEEMARRVFFAPFVVLSHNKEADPIVTYCNQAGLRLFEMTWDDMLKTPSRYTAETLERKERTRLLEAVALKGYIDDYVGVRISSQGRRFRIEEATVWNLLDHEKSLSGQAATFSSWTFI